jgi:hypothetical protein
LSGISNGDRSGSKVAEIFGADLRSLALFRIVLGVLVLADLANRATDLLAHYSDAGVMPRAALEPPNTEIFPKAQQIVSPFAISINMFSGEPLFQALVFLLGAVGAVALIFGWWTRVASVIAWVVILSIQQRNPLVLASGDILLRMLLFWAMFLPLGAVWSLDRRRTGGRLSMLYFSFGTVALFMQIAFIYWFTALLKTGAEWRTDFSALYYALSLDQVARPLGQAMLDFPLLLAFLTVSTLLLEVVGPFLLFSPVFTGPVRTATIAAFMSLHFGILLTMDIGIFPFISAFCMVCFLPAWFWDTALPRLHAALPASLGNLARRLGGWRGEPSEGSEPVVLKPTFVNDLLVLVAFVLVLFWNLTTVSPVGMPTGTAPVALTLGLDQKWNMFAPRPTVDDGWYVIPGTLENGEQVDLMAVIRDDYDPPKEVSWEKPRVVAYMDKNEHWGKYLEFTGLAEYAHQRPYFSSYLCRAWNARNTGGERLEDLQIFYMRESTLPDYRTSEVERVRLWDQSCA